ncbi:MAG: SGNH/GDSL hydrolase family protein [Planctomycetaceae bacterium]
MVSVRRKRLFRVVALLGASALCWIVGEVVLLLTGVNNDYRNPATSELIPRSGGPYELAACGHVPFATIRIRYPTNPRGYFNANNAIDHEMNSVGWRDDEHRKTRPEKTYRILGIGDSYLFGQGVKGKDRCLTHLGNLLQAEFPSRTVETINSGQPGYNTVMEARVLKECGLSYHPNLVILHFVPNDVEPDIYTKKAKVEFFTEYITGSMATDWMSQHSEIWALLNRTIGGRIRGQAYIRDSIGSFQSAPEKWNACQGGLDSIVQSCREKEIPLLIVAFPFFYQLNGDYPFQPIHDRLREYCSNNDVPFLDLREHYRGFNGPELWVHPTDQHPNEKAHDIAAGVIAQFIQQDAKKFGLQE